MEKRHILLIDDDDFVRTFICKNLTHSGYEVTEAVDGLSGIKLIERGLNPDLVITDVVMPNQDGLETILKLRKKCPGVKVISISGASYGWGGDYLDMSLKLGSDAAFPKPVDIAELEKAIHKLLNTESASMNETGHAK